MSMVACHSFTCALRLASYTSESEISLEKPYFPILLFTALRINDLECRKRITGQITALRKQIARQITTLRKHIAGQITTLNKPALEILSR